MLVAGGLHSPCRTLAGIRYSSLPRGAPAASWRRQSRGSSMARRVGTGVRSWPSLAGAGSCLGLAPFLPLCSRLLAAGADRDSGTMGRGEWRCVYIQCHGGHGAVGSQAAGHTNS